MVEIVRLECRFHVFGSPFSGWQNERNHIWISFYDQGSSMSAFFLYSGKYVCCFIIWWIFPYFSVLSWLKISFRHKHIYCLKFEIATSIVRKKIYGFFFLFFYFLFFIEIHTLLTMLSNITDNTNINLVANSTTCNIHAVICTTYNT